jgi:hypothetical protein
MSGEKSLGTITVTDIVWQNKLYGKRKYIYDYKIPEVTNTITIEKETEPRRQLYYGGSLFVNQRAINSISPGILYKTKKDQIYTLNTNIDFNGNIIVGAGAYWKIKLRK